MASIILALIYLAFISLGLPDSLLGSAWPVMHEELNVPISSMGIISMMIAGCTIISSLFSDTLTRKFKTQYVTAVSVVLTCIGLFGFSISKSFWLVLIFTIPYGLGAGAIDSSLNNYVALHYSSRQMSWLHCFWGIGTIISPNIMAYALTKPLSYHLGYQLVAVIQVVIAIILWITLPCWKKQNKLHQEEEVIPKKMSLKDKFKIKHLGFLLAGFFAYCSVESVLMLWSSTYLVEVIHVSKTQAASFGAIFFIGMTVGRFLSGVVSNKVGDKWMIRIGQVVAGCGILLIILAMKINCLNLWFTIVGIGLTGIGCGPIYPSIIHATPANFSKENSQAIIGLQMAFAYLGTTIMPSIFGLFADKISFQLFPFHLLFFLILCVVMIELLNRKTQKDKDIISSSVSETKNV